MGTKEEHYYKDANVIQRDTEEHFEDLSSGKLGKSRRNEQVP